MVLTDLTLQQFRSYAKRSFSFSAETTLIIGPNTSGKTNILEAIMLMATGKSFRADTDAEMVRWGGQLSVVRCQLSAKVDETTLEIRLTRGEVNGHKTPTKKYLVNGIARRQIDFIGNLRAVLFWPEHLELVTDSPSIRRKYLDSVLVQVDREYRRNLQSYEKGLRQRNRLLDLINEGKAGRNQLLFWNQLLIRAGSYLTDKRAEYIDYVNGYQAFPLRQGYAGQAVTGFQLDYEKSIISESRLEQYRDEEIAAKATLVGPHRDDIGFFKKHGKEQLDLSKYGSRGEQRLAILWLKLAELAYLEQETGERPLLVLDDIFSELDREHRELVLALLGKQQTIVSSAEEEVVSLIKKHNVTAEVIRLKSE